MRCLQRALLGLREMPNVEEFLDWLKSLSSRETALLEAPGNREAPGLGRKSPED